MRTTLVLLIAIGAHAHLIAQSDERWRVPDSALAIVASEMDPPGGTASATSSFLRSAGSPALVALKRFGEIAAFSAPDHLSRCRFHDVGKSILEELRALGTDDVGGAIGAALAGPGTSPEGLPPVALKEKNVVANYLLHHLVALHLADQAASLTDRRTSLLERALEYEARAQGFLVDAFSPGHMRVPMGGILSSLHTVNTNEAHSFFSSHGLFVVNSRGEVWQAFGDQLMQWYTPTWEHVLEACCVSLRELFFVYHYQADSGSVPGPLVRALGNVGPAVSGWLAISPGDFYYTEAMPTLSMLPFPVSATWSVRTEEQDSHGMRIRRHYPQIGDTKTEVGFSDSTLTGPSSELLYSWDALPHWMHPDAWLPRQHVGDQRIRDLPAGRMRALASLLVGSDTAVTSVRYIQELDFLPSYSGLIGGVGGGSLQVSGSSTGMVTASVAYAPRWGFLPDFLSKFHFSGTVSIKGSFDPSDRMLLSGLVGVTLPLSLLSLSPDSPLSAIYGIRLDAGYTEGLRSLIDYRGLLLSAGLESATIPLGFTYLGIVIRPRVEVHYLQERISSIMVEFLII